MIVKLIGDELVFLINFENYHVLMEDGRVPNPTAEVQDETPAWAHSLQSFYDLCQVVGYGWWIVSLRRSVLLVKRHGLETSREMHSKVKYLSAKWK